MKRSGIRCLRSRAWPLDDAAHADATPARNLSVQHAAGRCSYIAFAPDDARDRKAVPRSASPTAPSSRWSTLPMTQRLSTSRSSCSTPLATLPCSIDRRGDHSALCHTARRRLPLGCVVIQPSADTFEITDSNAAARLQYRARTPTTRCSLSRTVQCAVKDDHHVYMRAALSTTTSPPSSSLVTRTCSSSTEMRAIPEPPQPLPLAAAAAN